MGDATTEPLSLARELMDNFSTRTGLTGERPPKRYLWTDAFAVCNFLGLHQSTGEARYRELALRLVDQVHHVLGRHREDDSRTGWISGLDEEEGERHPTKGGLRIGKELPERPPGQPQDARQEWDRDGQYFHYLTKWMHALHRVSQETGERIFHRWAVELVSTTHKAFTYRVSSGGPLRMYWKMSIEFDRPLVPSMGHHDPLDGLITYLDLRTEGEEDLETEISEAAEMCRDRSWATDDALGIGGLLTDVGRLGRLVLLQDLDRRDLLEKLIRASEASLRAFSRGRSLERPATHRLPFRELGLSIGLHAVESLRSEIDEDHELASDLDALLEFQPQAQQIELFWSEPANRRAETWTGHEDINAVMLATSLEPGGYV